MSSAKLNMNEVTPVNKDSLFSMYIRAWHSSKLIHGHDFKFVNSITNLP